MKSIWRKNTKLKSYHCLKGNISVDTVVIGGGIAGLLIAHRLKERGIQAVVIEAEKICSGQTENTTAKITSQHGIIYSKILQNYGEAAAKEYAKENEKAIADYEKLIKSNHISCSFERKSAVIYSCNSAEQIEEEATAAKKAGINCYVTVQTELLFPVKAALVFENQAQFNPLAFLSAITEKLEIYENTRAIKVENNKVVTDKGSIYAKNIVFACHFPFVNFPGLYFLRMHQERSYAVSSKWNGKLNGMYIDAVKGISLRDYENNIIIGGEGHRTGKPNMSNPFETLEAKGKQLFSDFKAESCWSAQDCMTLDGIPYIGKMTDNTQDIYVATGFNKWGMTSAMVSANRIADMICGLKSYDDSVFSPSRFGLFATASEFCGNTCETIKGFAGYFTDSVIAPQDIKAETAGIINYKGKKCGAYRCKGGKLYIVSLQCPHLKCCLKWNNNTKSWDCPCHGSRYDYKGQLLDNPAQQKSILIAEL